MRNGSWVRRAPRSLRRPRTEATGTHLPALSFAIPSTTLRTFPACSWDGLCGLVSIGGGAGGARQLCGGVEGVVFTVEMARQMGKNELSAHLEAYLLYRYQRRGGTIVKCAPTLSPQTLISRLRLESILDRPWLAPYWQRAHGNMVAVGKARVMFLSAHEQSNVVGATADLLLEVDEAQDVDEEKFAKEFLPMAAAQNATIVLYGTPWTKDTLLAKYKALNLAHEENTGERRHFSCPWQVGARENPRYGAAVRAQIRQRGEDDLVIRTQYCLEEVDDATGFFTPPLQAALQGTHLRQQQPQADAHYVAAVDVAGEETAPQQSGQSRRDSTVVLIGERVWRHDPVLGFALPAVNVVNAYEWTGLAHHRAVRPPRALAG